MTVSPAPATADCADSQPGAFEFTISNTDALAFAVPVVPIASPPGCDAYYVLSDWNADPLVGNRTIHGTVSYSPATPPTCTFALGLLANVPLGFAGDGAGTPLMLEVQAPTCQASATAWALFGGESSNLDMGVIPRGEASGTYPVTIFGTDGEIALAVTTPGVTFAAPESCATQATCTWNGSDAVALMFQSDDVGTAVGQFIIGGPDPAAVLGAADVRATSALPPVDFGVVFVGDQATRSDTYQHVHHAKGVTFERLDLQATSLDPEQYDFYFQALPAGITGCDNYAAGELVHCEFDPGFTGNVVSIETNSRPRQVGYLSDAVTATTSEVGDAPVQPLAAIAVRLVESNLPGQPITPGTGYAFGAVPPGQATTRTFVLEVPPGVEVSVGAPLDPQFVLGQVTGPEIAQAGAPAVYTIPVTVTPQAPGDVLAIGALPLTFGVPSQDEGGSTDYLVEVPLWAAPVPASASAPPLDVAVCDGAPVSLEATLTNTGDAPLHVTGAAVSNNAFVANGMFPTVVAPGLSTSLHLSAEALALGTNTATINWAIDELGELPGDITVDVQPALAVGPSTLAFGEADVGDRSPWQAVTVQTCGPGPQSVAIELEGAVDSFELDSAAGNLQVPGGAPVAVPVRFAPTAAGDVEATVTLSYVLNGTSHAVEVNLTGTGVDDGGGGTDDGATDDGATDDGATDDGATDDGAASDNTTYYACSAGTAGSAGPLAVLVALALGRGARRRRTR